MVQTYKDVWEPSNPFTVLPTPIMQLDDSSKNALEKLVDEAEHCGLKVINKYSGRIAAMNSSAYMLAVNQKGLLQDHTCKKTDLQTVHAPKGTQVVFVECRHPSNSQIEFRYAIPGKLL